MGTGIFLRQRAGRFRLDQLGYLLRLITYNIIGGIVFWVLTAYLLINLSFGGILVVLLLYFIPITYLQVCRYHDLNKSGWWVAIPWALLAYFISSGLTESFNVLLGVICAILFIWQFIELTYFKGTEGANKYGEDPLVCVKNGKRYRLFRRDFIGNIRLDQLGYLLKLITYNIIGGTIIRFLTVYLLLNLSFGWICALWVIYFIPIFYWQGCRYHDLNKSGWFVAIPYVFLAVIIGVNYYSISSGLIFEKADGLLYFNIGFGVICAILFIWQFIEITYFKGTDGKNFYGESPIEYIPLNEEKPAREGLNNPPTEVAAVICAVLFIWQFFEFTYFEGTEDLNNPPAEAAAVIRKEDSSQEESNNGIS